MTTPWEHAATYQRTLDDVVARTGMTREAAADAIDRLAAAISATGREAPDRLAEAVDEIQPEMRQYDIHERLAQITHAKMTHFHLGLERACERSLQGGEHGVSVIYDEHGHYVITVDPDVPFGQIYHYTKGKPT